MTDTLKVPEKTRLRLVELAKAHTAATTAANTAAAALQSQLDTVAEMAGLDSEANNSIDLDTGIITPAAAPESAVPEPTPIRDGVVAG